MPKAYWVGAHMTVKDPEKLNAYAKLAAQASAKHGGVVLAQPEQPVTNGLKLAWTKTRSTTTRSKRSQEKRLSYLAINSEPDTIAAQHAVLVGSTYRT